MKRRILIPVITVAALCNIFFSPTAYATSNYNYKPGEYVVIVHGRSPNGRYSIASHGEGEFGGDNFHLYLMDAQTGKKIGPLEEVKDTFDTGADAYYAKWSADSSQVSISYRVDRHAAVMIRYSIKGRRAYIISGPTPVDKRS
ncbi:MAG: hypothetical protein PUP91_12455 [Rhizonema sp. PD37]|nr:hypothetical protein [Rhizonema sp. PD37]